MKNYQKGHSIVALSAPKQSLPAAKNNISFLKVSLFSRSGAFNVYFVPSSDFQVPVGSRYGIFVKLYHCQQFFQKSSVAFKDSERPPIESGRR